MLDRAVPTGSAPALGGGMLGFSGSITEIRSNDSGRGVLTAGDES